MLPLICAVALLVCTFLLYKLVKLDTDFSTCCYEMLGKSSADLNGQIVWITGAASGIGRALAVHLAASGCKLAISDLPTRVERLEQVRRECLRKNDRRLVERDVLLLPVDVTDVDSHQPAIDRLLAHFGNVHILVNNAGKMMLAEFDKPTMTQQRELFYVNVMSVISLSNLLAKHWLSVKCGGHLVVTSSLAAIAGMPFGATYAATKHAVDGYYESIQPELHCRGICVTIVNAGSVCTDIYENRVRNEEQSDDDMVKTKWIEEMQRYSMSAERCATIMGVAIANKMSVCWPMRQPYLLFAYFALYCPSMVRYAMRNLLSETRLKRIAERI